MSTFLAGTIELSSEEPDIGELFLTKSLLPQAAKEDRREKTYDSIASDID